MTARTRANETRSASTIPAHVFDLTTGSAALKHVAHNKTGIALAAEGKVAEALQSFEAAVTLRPTYAEAWFHRGLLLRQQGKLEAAYESFAQAAMLTPMYAAAHDNLAALASLTGRPKAILTSWLRRPEPGVAGRYARKVRRLIGLRDHIDYAVDEDKDEGVLRTKLEKSPHAVPLALAMGGALAAELRLVEAELFLRYALSLAPWSGECVVRLSVLLGRSPAKAGEIKTLALRAREAGAADDRLAPLALWHGLSLGEWHDYEALHTATLESLRRNPASVAPFVAVHQTPNPALHEACAAAFHRVFSFKQQPLNTSFRRDAGEPITIGYLSSDFREHPCARLFAELFELHDRTNFRIHGYSTWKDVESGIAKRIRSSFDKFVEFDGIDDGVAARAIADDAVDILVDLTGNTFNAKPRILAARPAPVQVSYLGYPGPSGSAEIDYTIADKITVPPEHKAWFPEAVVYMPDAYQVNDRKRRVAAKPIGRFGNGLPEQGSVFCCFNEIRKILPETFSVWMNILQDVPGSVLWLLSDIPAAIDNLRREASARNIDPKRLVFAGRVPNEQHLARYTLADLFLDTQPYGAHTTASDALWCGCPVLTILGDAFPGRVAASLLTAAGMPDLIVKSMDDYRNLAVRIGMDPSFRASVRQRLKTGRTTCALFDTPRFVRQMEWAYEQMWQGYVAGRKPVSFDVPREASLEGVR